VDLWGFGRSCIASVDGKEKMSFQSLALDYSKLPKVRTHAQLGRIGDVADVCSLNPTTWPNCINIFRDARREFQENYTKILQMENSYQTALQQLNAQPQSDARDDLINRTQQRASEAAEVRRQGVAVANELESKLSNWNWIPGFDAIFLSGLKGSRLGQVLPIATPPMAIFYVISGLVIVTSLAFIVGSMAHAWRATEEVEVAKHNAWGQCMKAFDSAISLGKTPPVCGGVPESQDWTTIALIGGSVILAFLLMSKR
jgi:hypothetical protein